MRNLFLNMNIASRLGLGFGALVCLIVVFGLIALYLITDLRQQSSLLYRHPLTVTRGVDAVEIEVLKIHREMKDLAHASTPVQVRAHQSLIAAHEEKALHQLEIVRSRFLGDAREVAAVHKLLIEWRPVRDEVIQRRIAGDIVAADEITRNKGARHVMRIESGLESLKSFAARIASDSLTKAEAITRQATVIIGLSLAAAMLLGTAIAASITRSIRKPLSRLDQAAAKVSRGDLKQRLEINSQDELGRLTSTFNSMVANIREQTDEIERKNEENERLLLNILPGPIADRLKHGEETIADFFPDVTVLFADIVGFTPLSTNVLPSELVVMLDRIFSAFDDSARRLGIEKIKTIGDAYMAVSGLTTKLDNPPTAMVEMALEMERAVRRINAQHGTSFEIRIGINCGPVVAGVIGKSKFIYDLWGEAVNLASRMESHGIAGRIQISQAVYERVQGHFKIESRGEINIRGKGMMPTYLVDASASVPHADRSLDQLPG